MIFETSTKIIIPFKEVILLLEESNNIMVADTKIGKVVQISFAINLHVFY